MKNYLFCDYATGEDFIVEAANTDSALRIANFYFEKPGKPLEISAELAESMGLDTY